MPIATLVIFLVGLSAALFGAWGRYTEAGRTHYDEMAGMIPYFAWWAGIILIVVAAILGIGIVVKR